MRYRFRGFRRTIAAGAVWAAVVVGLLAVPSPASGQEAVEPGLGNATAQGVKVDPRTGRLSFGVTYGLALSGHQNTVALAEVRSVDLGVIGTTLAGEGCDGGDPTYPKEDQPQPLSVRSTDEETQKSDSENGVQREALAEDTPFAHAVALTTGGGEPGAVEIGGTRSETTSGIVDGIRTATARTDVSSVSLGGGAVVMKGLTWEAVYTSAPEENATGRFSIEGMEIGGQAVPISEDNPLGPLAEANVVLEPLGFRIDPPVIRQEEGIQFVDPMRIGIVPSDNRETVLGPVFNALAPVRESVFDALIEADCSNASYITVLDIVLNAFTGAGSLNLELGGVTATSADLQRSSFLDGLPGPSLGAPTPAVPSTPQTPPATVSSSSGRTTTGVTPSTPTSTVVAPAPAPAGDDTSTPTPTDDVAIGDVEEIAGTRGGPLAAIGLGGLGLLAALAEGDRRKMRRAQRSAPMEATV